MKVLVACEESQRVCCAFRERGHEAYSCDILECSGGHPEWHICGDALNYINGSVDIYKTVFFTQDGEWHFMPNKWDLIIAHPPCTYLSNAGARHLWKGHQLNVDRYNKGLVAKDFFMQFLNANCDKIVVENPIPSKIYELPQYTQIIQPYQFYGQIHPYTKATCLWLKGVSPLEPIEEVEPIASFCPSGSYSYKHSLQHKGLHTKDRARQRSKTFLGVARAMAEQWGSI